MKLETPGKRSTYEGAIGKRSINWLLLLGSYAVWKVKQNMKLHVVIFTLAIGATSAQFEGPDGEAPLVGAAAPEIFNAPAPGGRNPCNCQCSTNSATNTYTNSRGQVEGNCNR